MKNRKNIQKITKKYSRQELFDMSSDKNIKLNNELLSGQLGPIGYGEMDPGAPAGDFYTGVDPGDAGYDTGEGILCHSDYDCPGNTFDGIYGYQNGTPVQVPYAYGYDLPYISPQFCHSGWSSDYGGVYFNQVSGSPPYTSGPRCINFHTPQEEWIWECHGNNHDAYNGQPCNPMELHQCGDHIPGSDSQCKIRNLSEYCENNDCGIGDGDCDNDGECDDPNSVCGHNNCGFGPDFPYADCCTETEISCCTGTCSHFTDDCNTLTVECETEEQCLRGCVNCPNHCWGGDDPENSSNEWVTGYPGETCCLTSTNSGQHYIACDDDSEEPEEPEEPIDCTPYTGYVVNCNPGISTTFWHADEEEWIYDQVYDCCPESWIGDGVEDCENQVNGCDLTCYDNDGGDCEIDDGGDPGDDDPGDDDSDIGDDGCCLWPWTSCTIPGNSCMLDANDTDCRGKFDCHGNCRDSYHWPTESDDWCEMFYDCVEWDWDYGDCNPPTTGCGDYCWNSFDSHHNISGGGVCGGVNSTPYHFLIHQYLNCSCLPWCETVGNCCPGFNYNVCCEGGRVEEGSGRSKTIIPPSTKSNPEIDFKRRSEDMRVIYRDNKKFLQISISRMKAIIEDNMLKKGKIKLLEKYKNRNTTKTSKSKNTRGGGTRAQCDNTLDCIEQGFPNHICVDGVCTWIIYGCTDPAATNYDSSANADNGTCNYTEGGTGFNCGDTSECLGGLECIYGVCREPCSFGMSYQPQNCQFGQPYICQINGTCTDSEEELSDNRGCTDPFACNYDAGAIIDDDSCWYNVEPCECVHGPGAYPNFETNAAGGQEGNCISLNPNWEEECDEENEINFLEFLNVVKSGMGDFLRDGYEFLKDACNPTGNNWDEICVAAIATNLAVNYRELMTVADWLSELSKFGKRYVAEQIDDGFLSQLGGADEPLFGINANIGLCTECNQGYLDGVCIYGVCITGNTVEFQGAYGRDKLINASVIYDIEDDDVAFDISGIGSTNNVGWQVAANDLGDPNNWSLKASVVIPIGNSDGSPQPIGEPVGYTPFEDFYDLAPPIFECTYEGYCLRHGDRECGMDRNGTECCRWEYDYMTTPDGLTYTIGFCKEIPHSEDCQVNCETNPWCNRTGDNCGMCNGCAVGIDGMCRYSCDTDDDCPASQVCIVTPDTTIGICYPAQECGCQNLTTLVEPYSGIEYQTNSSCIYIDDGDGPNEQQEAYCDINLSGWLDASDVPAGEDFGSENWVACGHFACQDFGTYCINGMCQPCRYAADCPEDDQSCIDGQCIKGNCEELGNGNPNLNINSLIDPVTGEESLVGPCMDVLESEYCECFEDGTSGCFCPPAGEQCNGNSGCTDHCAQNYDSTAVCDDGSCKYCPSMCLEPSACNYYMRCDDTKCNYTIEPGNVPMSCIEPCSGCCDYGDEHPYTGANMGCCPCGSQRNSCGTCIQGPEDCPVDCRGMPCCEGSNYATGNFNGGNPDGECVWPVMNEESGFTECPPGSNVWEYTEVDLDTDEITDIIPTPAYAMSQICHGEPEIWLTVAPGAVQCGVCILDNHSECCGQSWAECEYVTHGGEGVCGGDISCGDCHSPSWCDDPHQVNVGTPPACAPNSPYCQGIAGDASIYNNDEPITGGASCEGSAMPGTCTYNGWQIQSCMPPLYGG